MRFPWRRRRANYRSGRRTRVGPPESCAAWVESLEPRVVLATVGEVVPDFQLTDENDNSDRFGETISPRDYLEQVSGWYFIHTT